jgi:hypothetical protein
MSRAAGEVADGFLCHGFTTERWIREHTRPALAEGRRRAEMSGLIDDDVLRAFAVVAPPEDVATLVATRYAGLVDRISFIGGAGSPTLLPELRAAAAAC